MTGSREAWVTQMAGARALAAILATCREAKVDLVVVKGAVTSFLLYDDVAERHATDVDVRVRPRDRAVLREAAKRRGMQVLVDGGPYDVLTMLHGDVGVDVECHVGPKGMTRLSVDELLADAVEVRHPLGFLVPVPSLEHHALFLAVNCFKDRFVRATPWALEDARRIVRTPGFDHVRFAAIVRAARLATLVVIVATELGGPEWDDVRRRVEDDARPTYLAAYRSFARASRDGAAFRALSRVVADDPASWPEALARAAWLEWRKVRATP